MPPKLKAFSIASREINFSPPSILHQILSVGYQRLAESVPWWLPRVREISLVMLSLAFLHLGSIYSFRNFQTEILWRVDHIVLLQGGKYVHALG